MEPFALGVETQPGHFPWVDPSNSNCIVLYCLVLHSDIIRSKLMFSIRTSLLFCLIDPSAISLSFPLSPFPPFSGRGSVGLPPHQSQGQARLACKLWTLSFVFSLSLSLSFFSGLVGLWACCPPVTDTDRSRDTFVTKGQLLHLACPACLFQKGHSPP